MLPCFVFTLVLLIAEAARPSIPSSWNICQRSLPAEQFTACLVSSAEKAVRDVSVNGVPSILQPPIDPMDITQLYIGQGTGPVAIELNFTNVKIYGFRGIHIQQQAKYDIDKMDVLVPVTFPDGVRLEGDYKISGKVLILPINGEGKCTLNLKNLTGNAHFVGEPIKKKGMVYAKIKEFTFEFEPTGMDMHFENLFNGQKALSDQMNVFLNENWSDILKEVKPAIKEALGSAWREISNRIFTRFPYKDIFPQ